MDLVGLIMNFVPEVVREAFVTWDNTNDNTSTPTVSTYNATNITSDSATLNGEVTWDGGSSIIERGFTYSKQGSNTSIKVTVSSTSERFSKIVTELEPNTTYNFLAYARNSIGASSGYTKSFTTEDNSCTTPGTPSLSSPSNGATGVSTSPTLDWSNVSGADSYTLQVDNSSSFSSPNVNTSTTSSQRSVSGLSENTKYYWRVRAKNSCGDGSWSNVRNFTTENNATLPSIVTYDANDIKENSAILNGEVLDDGGSSIINRGFEYWNPYDLEDGGKEYVIGSTGFYSKNIEDLQPNTLYYYKAFASNEIGIIEGNIMYFTTNEYASILNVTTRAAWDVTSNSALLRGNADSDAAESVIERGFVYWDENHTHGDNLIVDGTIGNYSISIDGLESNTTYNYLAYARNNEVTVEGVTRSFVTDNSTETHSITPADGCSMAPVMQIDTEYEVNINVGDYGLANPIDGQSYNGENVRGFWLRFEEPSGYVGDLDINIYDVSNNFDPVIGHKFSCGGIYYTQWDQYNTYVANTGSYGDSETFNDHSNDNGYTHYIRIYHYYGDETPNISFKIRIE